MLTCNKIRLKHQDLNYLFIILEKWGIKTCLVKILEMINLFFDLESSCLCNICHFLSAYLFFNFFYNETLLSYYLKY